MLPWPSSLWSLGRPQQWLHWCADLCWDSFAVVETLQIANCLMLFTNGSNLNVVDVQPVLSSFDGHVQAMVEAQHMMFCSHWVMYESSWYGASSVYRQPSSNVGGHVHIVSYPNNLGNLWCMSPIQLWKRLWIHSLSLINLDGIMLMK